MQVAAPERGLLGPEQFIGLAEESGLIVPLGRSVLRMASGRRPPSGRARSRGTSALDLDRQLERTPGAGGHVGRRRALGARRLGVLPSTLVLEITESMLLPGEGVTMERLRELDDLGVRLFIDDFGTGYSSLSYLQQLPVDGIKLAREFVCTLDAASADETSSSNLVSTIRSIAQTLGLNAIVAEGVETPEQRRGPARPRLHPRTGLPDGPPDACISGHRNAQRPTCPDD